MSTAKNENQKDDPGGGDFVIIKEFPHHGITLIRERYCNSWNVANIYVVHGTRMDLIVDTGTGLWDLPSFLRHTHLIDTYTRTSRNLAMEQTPTATTTRAASASAKPTPNHT